MEKICKTCKYWQVPDEDENTGQRICRPCDPDTFEFMELGFEIRLCNHPSQTFAESPTEINGFGLIDGSEYYACLATAEEFGCVRHEVSDEDRIDHPSLQRRE